PTSEDACVEVMDTVHISRKDDRTLLNGEDVEAAIRSAAVDANVSAVARHPRVRAQLVEWQREAVGAEGGVVEGRDAAAVIVPDATLKVWLTAPVAVCARRRAQQLGASAAEAERFAGALAARDEADSANTFQADDAVVIDTADDS